ncbi:MAG: hypothetical protein ACTSR8_12945 [Promethearchaeota archaeon]
MDIDDDILDALFALIGFSLFFIFATLGAILASTNEDSYLFINFEPAEDYLIIIGLLMIHLVFIFYYLLKTFRFRHSKGLEKRYGELLETSDKMLVYSFFFLPAFGYVLFYSIKYFNSSIAFYLLLTLLFEFGLLTLIVYNSLHIRKDYKEEVSEK